MFALNLVRVRDKNNAADLTRLTYGQSPWLEYRNSRPGHLARVHCSGIPRQ